MRWCSVVAIAPAVAGCSLIYNPNNLPDPRVIDAAVADVNPTMPVVLDFAPLSIDEGQGEGGSLPALLVLHGQNLVNAHPSLTLTPPQGVTVHVDTVGDISVSSGGDYMVFQVVAHVDHDLTGPVQLEVAVTQDVSPQYGGGTATSAPVAQRLTLNGLPELTGAPEVTSGTLTTQRLKPKYSMVNLKPLGTVKLANDPAPTAMSTPALIQAVSSITAAALTATASNDRAGPGGFHGAVAKGQGPGGGSPGTAAQVAGTGGGGGGAGLATIGGNGGGGGLGGSMGGAGGNAVGNDLLVPLDGNVPSAGGGGGAGSLVGGAAGGAGGGGGGVVELIAGGDITTDTITAGGGSGKPGAAGVGSGGGGGGGAGGVVLVSSATGVVKTGAITVPAGGGGAPNGGTSSVGRVRWDAVDGTAPSPTRPAHRGPAFMLPPRIVTRSPQTFTVLGTQSDGFSVRVTDQQHTMHDGEHVSVAASSTALVSPALYPGYNQICILLDGGSPGQPEANKCIEVAYLP
jgi:hypothetical protein